MMSLLILIFEFFKIGLFSIGGGLATLPFLYRLADKYPWFSAKQIPDMIAVSESTPGPLGINMATYTGFQHSGVIGSIAATFGLVLPSVIIIILISKVLEKFRSNKYVEYAFYGLRPAVLGCGRLCGGRLRDRASGREISSVGCAFAARAVSFSDGGGLLLMGDSRISAGASGRRGAVSCLGRHFA